ncbi:hypothetical protein SZN_07467 [Streptomyces zinciresistens K42]|uniref:Uncharacterized protein n=1 Tax=Streptomyces zinciresistens K42 TaxID=700597 RepID=G2G7N0_9ACTN|nr:hypothetical protein SZN_07467 [Streptomyces zinciresistens K42]
MPDGPGCPLSVCWTTGGLRHEGAAYVVAEPASDAVRHERVPGRDVRPGLRLRAGGVPRVEATDARGDRLPRARDAGGGEPSRAGGC